MSKSLGDMYKKLIRR